MDMYWEQNGKNLQFAWQVSPDTKIFKVQTEGGFYSQGKLLLKGVMDGALLMGLSVVPGSRHCPSLWAGTNGGTVYAFCLRVPPAERRMDEPVRAEQGKCLVKAGFCWV